jgi:hypothetical protein
MHTTNTSGSRVLPEQPAIAETTLGLFITAICLTKGSKNCATNTPNVSAGSKKHGHSHQVRVVWLLMASRATPST